MALVIGRLMARRLINQFNQRSVMRNEIPSFRFFSTDSLPKEELEKMVKNNKVVVFMKGVPDAPKCGFSNAVVQILRMHAVNYDSHDVLESDSIRQGIKDFTNWPTIPQVFINGEFVGGCDILLQMHQNGELIDELKKVGITSALLKETEDKSSEKK
ncbi:glutaredoxin-related protein 5, mitochondrial [Sitodiplosis mosellana]|uniref:glutaredoxin-related protein 5, mitochondrial n=1 Tax=Sitodiplosis mosellana TaxID=263140 RepID=UPI002445196A|nr:glutaredoxin-related protein 5, mitochondrial [Sitodiplosis mosellana]